MTGRSVEESSLGDGVQAHEENVLGEACVGFWGLRVQVVYRQCSKP